MKLIPLAGLLLLAVLCSGCMSNGGLVVGPFSAMSAASNEKAKITRAIRASSLEDAKKVKILSFVNLGMRDDEIAGGVGIDVLALGDSVRNSSLSWGEIGQQALSVLGDGLLYVGTGAGTAKLIKEVNGNSGTHTINLTGNDNVVIVGDGAAVSIDRSYREHRD